MSATLKLPDLMTVDQFFDWCPNDHQRWQLVDGQPVAMAPANLRHGAMQAELGALIRNHLRAHNSSCTVITNPGVIPYVQSTQNFRIPDLAVTCAPIDSAARAMPEPLLLIEILSPSNPQETWANVWTYATIPSVQEILALATSTHRADLLRRQPGGSWPTDPLAVTAGPLSLDSIALTLDLADIYRA